LETPFQVWPVNYLDQPDEKIGYILCSKLIEVLALSKSNFFNNFSYFNYIALQWIK
jgi:hypothetical protein